jgi:hypothetical protein
MTRLIIFPVVLALFGAVVTSTFAVPEPSHVPSKSLEGPDIRVEVSTCVPERPYAGCDSTLPPSGTEGPNCR